MRWTLCTLKSSSCVIDMNDITSPIPVRILRRVPAERHKHDNNIYFNATRHNFRCVWTPKGWFYIALKTILWLRSYTISLLTPDSISIRPVCTRLVCNSLPLRSGIRTRSTVNFNNGWDVDKPKSLKFTVDFRLVNV
jgi:hypothetical protein